MKNNHKTFALINNIYCIHPISISQRFSREINYGINRLSIILTTCVDIIAIIIDVVVIVVKEMRGFP